MFVFYRVVVVILVVYLCGGGFLGLLFFNEILCTPVKPPEINNNQEQHGQGVLVNSAANKVIINISLPLYNTKQPCIRKQETVLHTDILYHVSKRFE